MGSAAAKPAPNGAIEIRIRFEPGLGSRLYASLKSGEVGPVTVARALGRGRTLLRYHGYTLMAHGAPEWRPGESFSVYVKQLGPPLILARVVDDAKGLPGPVTTVDTSVVPGLVEQPS
jgi:hypothetical protein